VSAALPTGPALVFDAAGATVRTGLLGGPGGNRWRESEDEALVALFADARSLLAEAGLGGGDLARLILCRGPGSVLGLRVASLALATLAAGSDPATPVLGYRSLDAAAQAALDAGIATPPFTVCADFKEGRWVLLRVADAAAPVRLLALETAAADAVVAPAGEAVLYLPMRKRWRPPPAEALEFQPTLDQLDRALRTPGLLRPLASPADLELGPPPQYQTWSGERHRLPGTPEAPAVP